MSLIEIITIITYVIPLVISVVWLTTELIDYYKVTKEPFEYYDLFIIVVLIMIPLLNVLVMKAAIIEWLDLDKQ